MAVHTRPVCSPRDPVTAARVLAIPRWELCPGPKNQVEIKFSIRGYACIDGAHQTARLSFLDTLSLFRDSQCARKLETRTQYKIKLTEFAPFFARGLAICYDEMSLPDRISNQIQNQHVLL